MTKDEVIDALGKPKSSSAKDNIMYLKYRLYKECLFIDDYYVKLKDGNVEAYGHVGEFGEGY